MKTNIVTGNREAHLVEDLAPSSGEKAGCRQRIFSDSTFKKKKRVRQPESAGDPEKESVPILGRQNLLPERSTQVQILQERFTGAGVSKLRQEADRQRRCETTDRQIAPETWPKADTYMIRSKAALVNGKLFRSNLLFQGRGIGTLQEEETQTQ